MIFFFVDALHCSGATIACVCVAGAASGALHCQYCTTSKNRWVSPADLTKTICVFATTGRRVLRWQRQGLRGLGNGDCKISYKTGHAYWAHNTKSNTQQRLLRQRKCIKQKYRVKSSLSTEIQSRPSQNSALRKQLKHTHRKRTQTHPRTNTHGHLHARPCRRTPHMHRAAVAQPISPLLEFLGKLDPAAVQYGVNPQPAGL